MHRSDDAARSQLVEWIRTDASRMEALRCAATRSLPDWCIAAGFVRNLVWDKLHGYVQPTPLTDVDLIYHDTFACSSQRDADIETELNANRPAWRWSVKNQARMHLRNGDAPYRSSEDAMRYWPEMETAVGVRMSDTGDIDIVSPFGVTSLFALHLTPNPRRYQSEVFARRLAEKQWLQTWPRLKVVV